MMRAPSRVPGNWDAVSSEWISHAACARNARSKAPARNCGRPKRSRVKNRGIGWTMCFTMWQPAFGEKFTALEIFPVARDLS